MSVEPNVEQKQKDTSELLNLGARAQEQTGKYLQQVDETINSVGGEVVKSRQLLESVLKGNERYEHAMETYRDTQDKVVEATQDFDTRLKSLSQINGNVGANLKNAIDTISEQHNSIKEQQNDMVKALEKGNMNAEQKFTKITSALDEADQHIKSLNQKQSLIELKNKIDHISDVANDFELTSSKRDEALSNKLERTNQNLDAAVRQMDELGTKANNLDNDFTALLSKIGKIAIQVDSLTKQTPTIRPEMTRSYEVPVEEKIDRRPEVTIPDPKTDHRF